jgi:hypothetical protein
MPDYSSLSTQITQFKTAATTLMNSGSLTSNDLQLVGAALNAMGNTLGVADINNSVNDGITTINTTRDTAITSFNTSTNGTRLTTAESSITDLQGRTTNIEGFVSTSGTQYSTLTSAVAGLQSSLSTVPSSWKIVTTSVTALNNDRMFVNAGGITVTLPLNPSLGYQVQVVDITGAAATTSFTIARNSQKIQGLAENLVVNVNGARVTLVYSDAVRGWTLT